MNKAKLATTITTALILMLLASPAYAATVTVTTNKTAYGIGDALVVSGTVSPVTAGQDVAIQAFGPAGELKAIAQATPAADGTYSTTVMVFASGDPVGAWSVKATYQAVSATASFTLTGVPARTSIVLDIAMDVAPILFKGEKADFYALISYQGAPMDANVTATLYQPAKALTAVRVALGLYQITYNIPADASTGTYVLVVNASVLTTQYEGKGVALKAFELSATLTSWGTTLVAIQGDVVIIKGKIVTIEGNIATINTSIGTINGTIVSIQGDVATIKTNVGTLITSVSAAQAAATAAQTAATGAKSAVDAMSTPLYAAVVLALVAAIAAIASVIQISRKIAG